MYEYGAPDWVMSMLGEHVVVVRTPDEGGVTYVVMTNSGEATVKHRYGYPWEVVWAVGDTTTGSR